MSFKPPEEDEFHPAADTHKTISVEEVVQFIFEALFQFLFEAFADSIWRRLPEPARVTIKMLCASAFAALLGFLSTLVVPEPFIADRSLALAHLIAGPLLIGWIMARIGRFFESHDRRRTSLERFGYGWLFAVTFNLVRYLLLHT